MPARHGLRRRVGEGRLLWVSVWNWLRQYGVLRLCEGWWLLAAFVWRRAARSLNSMFRSRCRLTRCCNVQPTHSSA